MSDKEIKLADYIDLPYHRFIMTRMEFLIFTQNEQKAKILRLIEWAIENERGRMHAKGQKVPEIVFAGISNRFMMEQLMGTIQSETTLRNLIDEMAKDRLIFRRKGKGPYDSRLYTLNKHLMEKLVKLLPKNLDEIDMMSIMKQERQFKKRPDPQLLNERPTIIDPLVLKIRETIIDPPDPQLLTLYSPIIDPLLSTRDPQLLAPRRKKEKFKENTKESSTTDAKTEPTLPPNANDRSIKCSQETSSSATDSQPEAISANADLLHPSLHKNISSDTGTTPITHQVGTDAATPKDDRLSPEIQAILSEWTLCHTDAVHITSTVIRHATTLAGLHVAAGTIKAHHERLLEEASGFYREKGMPFGSVVQDIQKNPMLVAPMLPPSQPDQEELPFEPLPAEGMSLARAKAIRDEIKDYAPTLKIGRKELQKGVYILWIAISFGKCIFIRNESGWSMLPQDLLDQAIAYSIKQSEELAANTVVAV